MRERYDMSHSHGRYSLALFGPGSIEDSIPVQICMSDWGNADTSATQF